MANSSSILFSPAVFTAFTVTAKVASLPLQDLDRIVGGKGHVDRALVAGLGADQLILEARDQPARAELDRHVLALAAVERLAADLAVEVDDDEVADAPRRASWARRTSACVWLASWPICSSTAASSGSTVSRSSFELVDLRGRHVGKRLEADLDLGVLARLVSAGRARPAAGAPGGSSAR